MASGEAPSVLISIRFVPRGEVVGGGFQVAGGRQGGRDCQGERRDHGGLGLGSRTQTHRFGHLGVEAESAKLSVTLLDRTIAHNIVSWDEPYERGLVGGGAQSGSGRREESLTCAQGAVAICHEHTPNRRSNTGQAPLPQSISLLPQHVGRLLACITVKGSQRPLGQGSFIINSRTM
jgi:hypothetical protein